MHTWAFCNSLDFPNRIYYFNSDFSDEEPRSVSFHTCSDLVAGSNIEGCWREAALDTGPYAGGKTR